MNDVARFRAQFARLLLIVLWINAGLLGLTPGTQPLLGQQTLILAGIGLAALGTLALYLYRIDWPARQITSMATLGQVMLLVYAFAGHPYQSDMHMYFFAMLAVLAGWLDWRIFLPATVAIAAHHLALSLLQPAGVFQVFGGHPLDRVGRGHGDVGHHGGENRPCDTSRLVPREAIEALLDVGRQHLQRADVHLFRSFFHGRTVDAQHVPSCFTAPSGAGS